jgi:hypothetical protein
LARYICTIIISLVSYAFFVYKEHSVSTPQNNDQYFNIVFKPHVTIIEINKIKFIDCVAYKISFDGEYFGIFLNDDIIYLPPKKPQDKHQLSITCTDNDDKDKKEKTWEITQSGTIYDE